MACDLDRSVEQVPGELKYWGEWFLDSIGVNGFRLDAVTHIGLWFFNEWLDHVCHYAQQ